MAENNNIPQGANKYSVYAQRNVESTQVDWNKIAGELTKGAEAIRDERQGRKDAIDTETQNSMEQLSKVEGANNQDAASLLINGSSMSVEALRVQTDMLKRGLIKPKDYKLFMQQQKTGYANLNTAVKGWDKWATEANERLKTAEGTLGPKAGGLEIYQNNLTSALGNLKNKKLWSNPINGQLQLVTMGKDKGGSYNVMPDYYKNKAAYQNPNTMNDLMKYQQDRFDLKNATKGITSKVGQIIKAFVSGPEYNILTGGGAIKTVSDFRQFGEFGSDLKGNKITLNENALIVIHKQKEVESTSAELKANTEILSKKLAEIIIVEKEIIAVQQQLAKHNLRDVLAEKDKLSISESHWKQFQNLTSCTIKPFFSSIFNLSSKPFGFLALKLLIK